MLVVAPAPVGVLVDVVEAVSLLVQLTVVVRPQVLPVTEDALANVMALVPAGVEVIVRGVAILDAMAD